MSESNAKFNLIDEPWISVVTDYKGQTKLVGLKEFFENAHNYIALAGDMPTQDFAVMRFLLAILHTVFSRYDANGNPYEMIELNDRMQQTMEVYEEDEEEYEDALIDTWKDLWTAGKFPEIVVEYLEKWHDRFYLFHDKYPFYQVTKNDVDESKISKSSPSIILGKNINRLISQSGNKTALFSPKYEANSNKEKLTYDEVARWILMYQSYTGLSDKVTFGKEKYKSSKGWLFDIGGVYVSSINLYKTLLLNLNLYDSINTEYNNKIQKPCWEFSPSQNIAKYFMIENLDNVSELYTAWSRAIFIESQELDDDFSMGVVKLPEIIHEDQFLEPMTIWKYNTSGDNDGKFTPRKYKMNRSAWRSFGLMTKTEKEGSDKEPNRKPGIIDWLNYIDKYIRTEIIKINSVSMEDDGNATSWVPTNEIVDSFYIEENVINDIDTNGWIEIINNVIDDTKFIIDSIFRGYINDIKKIRNIESNSFINNNVESLYNIIDKPFRDWLSNIKYNDSKDEKRAEWERVLKPLVIFEAEKYLENSSIRDFTGIEESKKIKNIATSYNMFLSKLNNKHF